MTSGLQRVFYFSTSRIDKPFEGKFIPAKLRCRAASREQLSSLGDSRRTREFLLKEIIAKSFHNLIKEVQRVLSKVSLNRCIFML